MARLIESRARSERVAADHQLPFVGNKVVWEKSAEMPGHLCATGEVYTIGVGQYRLELTEHDALIIMSALVDKMRAKEQHRVAKTRSP